MKDETQLTLRKNVSAGLGASLSPVNKENCMARVQRTLVRFFLSLFFVDTFHLRGWITRERSRKYSEERDAD